MSCVFTKFVQVLPSQAVEAGSGFAFEAESDMDWLLTVGPCWTLDPCGTKALWRFPCTSSCIEACLADQVKFKYYYKTL